MILFIGVSEFQIFLILALAAKPGRGPPRLLMAYKTNTKKKDEDVDHAFCAANGIDVVRRRSGGGAVYVHPTESFWIDIVVPRGDALWNDDIGKSMWWIGMPAASISPTRSSTRSMASR